MLKRKDLKFRLSTRHKEFAVCQFAEFMKPTDVVTAVMEQFKTELAADIEKHGEGEIRRYLSHNFWTLNPKNGKMPEKFKERFETHKKLYLRTYSDSYLRHPRNVVRELDNLYQKCTEQLENADPDKARQLMPTMLKIIQTIRNTIDAIPFDEIEKEEELFQTVGLSGHYSGELEAPDPLDEEDEHKLKELIQTEAPFDDIQKFIEYLRCKDQNLLFVQFPDKDPKEGPYVIRGRLIQLAPIPQKESEQNPSSTTE